MNTCRRRLLISCATTLVFGVCVFTSLKGRARVAETWFEGNRSN